MLVVFPIFVFLCLRFVISEEKVWRNVATLDGNALVRCDGSGNGAGQVVTEPSYLCVSTDRPCPPVNSWTQLKKMQELGGILSPWTSDLAEFRNVGACATESDAVVKRFCAWSAAVRQLYQNILSAFLCWDRAAGEPVCQENSQFRPPSCLNSSCDGLRFHRSVLRYDSEVGSEADSLRYILEGCTLYSNMTETECMNLPKSHPELVTYANTVVDILLFIRLNKDALHEADGYESLEDCLRRRKSSVTTIIIISGVTGSISRKNNFTIPLLFCKYRPEDCQKFCQEEP